MVCKLIQTTESKDENLDIGHYTNMGLIARALTQAGYVLYAMDLLGHGFSEGERFYIPRGDYTIHFNDLDAFVRFAISDYHASPSSSTLPFFLMGDSYGGTLALHVARKWQDYPTDAPSSTNFAGLVLASPGILADLPPLVVVWFLRYGLAPFFPKWTPFFMPDPLPAELNWKEEAVRLTYTSDTEKKRGLMADKPFSLGTALGLLRATEDLQKDVIKGLAIPFAVAHGTLDEAVPIAGTDLLLEQCVTKPEDRAVKRVVGAFHDLLSEQDRQETMQFFIDWMNIRVTN